MLRVLADSPARNVTPLTWCLLAVFAVGLFLAWRVLK